MVYEFNKSSVGHFSLTSQALVDLPMPHLHKRSPLWLDVGYPSVLAVADGIHVVICHKVS